MRSMNNGPLRVGDRAPAFSVPSVKDDSVISLDDYRGRQGLFLGLYRGLHCPFCRRHLAQLNLVQAKLAPLGVAVVSIVNTPRERAQFYFRNDRSGVRIGADPDRQVHAAYAVTKIEIVTAEARSAPWPVQTTIEEFLSARVNPTGEMAAPVNPLESNDVLNALDGFQPTEADDHIRGQHGTQLVGLFLIDRDGVVRWRYLEGETTPADIGRLPGPAEIVEAAARLSARGAA